MVRGEQHDVLVIGGGVSGLTAAIALAADGLTVRVLEARARLGGRIATGDVAGLSVETGGEFLDDIDGPLARILDGLGVGFEPALRHTQPTAATVLLDAVAGPPSARALELASALDDEIDSIAARLDPDAPWECEGAASLDAISLAGWVAGQGGDEAALALVEAIHAVGGSTVPTVSMSLLAMAAKQARRGPRSRRLTLRIAGGAAAFTIAAHDRLEHRVTLGAPVVGLIQGARRVDLELRDGRRVHGRTVVVAVPLGPVRALAISPLPPTARLSALAELRTGHVVKAHVVFATPWWRDVQPSIVPAITDTACGSVYEGPVGHPGAVLSCFVGAGPAMGLLQCPEPERELAVLAALARVAGGAFPEPPIGIRLDCWNEQPETAGSYLVLRPGQLTRHRDALRRPHGRVVYAGAEVSSSPSFIAGAAEAGERAAAIVRTLL